jgi:protein O-mannosyl-transferase
MTISTRGGKHDRHALIYAGLALAAILPYLNTLWAGFVYDDNYQIVGNPYLRSFHYIKQILFTPVWSFKYAKVPTNYYRPLMPLQYLVLYQAYGPLSYVFHLANILFHAAVVILLFVLTARLFKSEKLALFAALLFAVHPIHTEVVAWVAALPDLHLGVFLLIAFWFYLNLREPEKRRWWTPWAAYGSFFLALYSKEPAIAFAGVMMIFEHWLAPGRSESTSTQKAKRYAPLWGLTAAYLLSRVFLIGGLVPKVQRPRLPWETTLLTSVSMFGEYMNKLVWPAHLSMFHATRFTWSMFDPDFLAGAGWIFALAFLALLLWKVDRIQVLSVIWIVAFLAPALNARWMPGTVFAERYLYLPSMGFCWLVARVGIALWDYLGMRRWAILRPVTAACAAAILVVFSVRSYARNEAWHDDLTLFGDAVQSNPDEADLRADFGFAYWEKHQMDSAIEQWQIALSINPKSFWALDDMGMAYVVQSRYSQAVPLLRQALQLSPQFTNAHLHLADAYIGLHDDKNAETEFRAAIESSPLDADAHNRLAKFYLDHNRVDEAQEQYEVSLKADLTSDAMDGLGDIALLRNQNALAESYFRRAADFDSYDHHAHYELVFLYVGSGRVPRAIQEYKLGLQTDPGTDALSKRALAALQSTQGKDKL